MRRVLPPDDPFPVGRRIHAALRLADYTFEDLERVINVKNFRASTLRKIARDHDTSRVAAKSDLTLIADATGLPIEFFTTPAPKLMEAIHNSVDSLPGDPLTGRVDQIEQSLNDLRAELARTAFVRAAQADESSAQRTADPPVEDRPRVPKAGRRR